MRPTTKDLARAAGSQPRDGRPGAERPAGVRKPTRGRGQPGDRAHRLRAQPLRGQPGPRAHLPLRVPAAAAGRPVPRHRGRPRRRGARGPRRASSSRCAAAGWWARSRTGSRASSRRSPDALDGVALMAPESPQVRDATARLRERGVRVVQFVSGQPGEGDFVGVDNRAAGATAGHLMGRFVGGRPGEILVVAETLNARDSLERRHGLRPGHRPRLRQPARAAHARDPRGRRAHPRRGPPRLRQPPRDRRRLRAELRGAGRARGDRRGQRSAAPRRSSPTSGPASPRALLTDGQLDAVIAQNPGHLVRSALRVLRARCDNREPIASQEEIRSRSSCARTSESRAAS